ncbi:CLL_collapsed_G0029350.mRNA.1.CDS.1 [Saccharomyces cerevisiae]|nr:CLL_collapsed_G0029350.mRNA.1.CDS.1 [Saccharomyces cerevisiae]
MVLNPSKYQDTRTWKMTPAMIRARKPFFKGNMLGLTLLLGVTGSLVLYHFADVPTTISEPQAEAAKKKIKRPLMWRYAVVFHQ